MRAEPIDRDPMREPGTRRSAGRRGHVVGEHDREGVEKRAARREACRPEPAPVGGADAIDQAEREQHEDCQRHEAVDHHQEPAQFEGMVAERPAGEPVEQPVGARAEHGEERRLARIEPQIAGGIRMDDGIDRVPARLHDEVVDRERAPFHQPPDRQPAAAIVAGEKRPDEPFFLLDLRPDRLGVGLLAGGLGLGHGVGDQLLLKPDAIDAGDRADAAEHRGQCHRRQNGIHAVPQPGSRVALAGNLDRANTAPDLCRHPREVEETVEESCDAIFRVAEGSRPVVHRHLHHAKTLRRRQHRNEAVHALRHLEPAHHVAAKCLETAVVIVEPEAGEQADEPVEHPRGHRLVPGIESWRLPAVDEIGPGSVASQQAEHAGDLDGVVLPVAVEHHDPVCSAFRKPGREGRRFALPTFQANAVDTSVGHGQGLDLRPRAIGGAIIDKEQFPGEASGVERGVDLGDQRGDVASLITHGNDE